MKIKLLEDEKDKLKLEIDSVTFVNLLNENLWKQKIDYAAYNISHPYLSNPVLTISAKDPKKALFNAAEQVLSDVKELRKQLAKA